MADTIKMLAPDNGATITVEGVLYTADSAGFVNAPPMHIDAFLSHAFSVISPDQEPPEPIDDPNYDPDAGDIETMKRGELFALLRKHGVAVSIPISNEELRIAARKVAANAVAV